MGAQRKRNKIGRNDPCHCDSGLKFKRCHGAAEPAFTPLPAGTLDEALRLRLQELQALQIQRGQQQGLGRPIVSTVFKGHRLVAVGNRLYHSKRHRQLYAALKKKTEHMRVVFIDVNVPDSSTEGESVGWLREALADIRGKESTMTIDGAAAPPAYVFLTNHPYHYALDSIHYRRSLASEGFKIPDFRLDASFFSIRDALAAREKHHEMSRLMASARDYNEIPATFDGTIPEFAFGNAVPRLHIGHRYFVPDADGREVPAVLSDATVVEQESMAYGVYRLDDGRSVICSCPMAPEELAAYRRHPDTFFGIHKDQGKRIDDPLDLYDRAFQTYRHSSKEKLLEFMSSWPDSDRLKHLDQQELAIRYCENLVHAMMTRKKGVDAEHLK